MPSPPEPALTARDQPDRRDGGPALHGRRVGKPLSAYQRGLIETLLPRLAVPPGGPLDPATLFAEPCEVWLEIGFGSGEHLIDLARRRPDIGLIGCEPFLNGLARALAAIDADGLDNVRLHDGDAGALVARLPDTSLARVIILYPDPWPKRRQRKRRFLSDATLAQLARVLRPGAELRFATDIDDYSGWTLARLLRSPEFDWPAEIARDWQTPWPDWPSTRYERKASAQGRQPCYITAIRRPADRSALHVGADAVDRRAEQHDQRRHPEP